MKNFHKSLLIGLCAQGVLAGGLHAASTTYVFSGHIDSVTDYNNSTLALIGASPVYPAGIGPGTSFSVTMTLSDDLAAPSGSLDFDIGGLYQGHVVVSGNSLLCRPGYCVNDYNDPAYTFLDGVSVGGSLRSPGSTNLPLNDPNQNEFVGAFIGFDIAPDTPKPVATTRLTDLPIVSISFDLSSFYLDELQVPCPSCVEGYTYLYPWQGWSLTGSANTISTVPVPAAAWLFGSGLLGLAGAARRRKR